MSNPVTPYKLESLTINALGKSAVELLNALERKQLV